MIVIYPDTNALHADLLMRRKVSTDMLDMLSPGSIEARLSPVVVEEAARQVREDSEKMCAEIGSVVAKARRVYRLDVADSDALVDSLHRQIAAEGERALQPLLDHDACRVLSWSRVTARELVERELARSKPILDKGGQSVGLRDTVIWHGLLELLEALGDEDFVIFVTADGAYVHDGALHDELCEELDDAGADTSRLRLATSLAAAVNEAKLLADLIGRRDGILTSELLEYVGSLEGIEWHRSAVPDDLDISEAGLPTGFEGAAVVSIDALEVESVGSSNPAECVLFAEFAIEGRMTPSDFVGSEDERLTMTGGDMNGYDVEVRFEVSATVYAEISYRLDDDVELYDIDVTSASVVWN